MKRDLELAVEIADLAAEAAEMRTNLDLTGEARRLAEEHPEARASQDAVEAALRDEHRAAALR